MFPPSRITASSQQVRTHSSPSNAVSNLHLRPSFELTIDRELGPGNSPGNSESIVEDRWLIMNSAAVPERWLRKAVFTAKQRQVPKRARRKRLKPTSARLTKIHGSPLRFGTNRPSPGAYGPAMMIRNPLGRGGRTWLGVPV